MSWNYRLTKKDDLFSLHEAYYNEDKEVCGLTQDPAQVAHYESVDELIDDLERMLKDAKRYKNDVLDYEMEMADWD